MVLSIWGLVALSSSVKPGDSRETKEAQMLSKLKRVRSTFKALEVVLESLFDSPCVFLVSRFNPSRVEVLEGRPVLTRPLKHSRSPNWFMIDYKEKTPSFKERNLKRKKMQMTPRNMKPSKRRMEDKRKEEDKIAIKFLKGIGGSFTFIFWEIDLNHLEFVHFGWFLFNLFKKEMTFAFFGILRFVFLS